MVVSAQDSAHPMILFLTFWENSQLKQVVACGRLKKVVEALLEWIKYIDSLQGKWTAYNIPYEKLRQKMEDTFQAVNRLRLQRGGGREGKIFFGL